jgi:hypothetical protein
VVKNNRGDGRESLRVKWESREQDEEERMSEMASEISGMHVMYNFVKTNIISSFLSLPIFPLLSL